MSSLSSAYPQEFPVWAKDANLAAAAEDSDSSIPFLGEDNYIDLTQEAFAPSDSLLEVSFDDIFDDESFTALEEAASPSLQGFEAPTSSSLTTMAATISNELPSSTEKDEYWTEESSSPSSSCLGVEKPSTAPPTPTLVMQNCDEEGLRNSVRGYAMNTIEKAASDNSYFYEYEIKSEVADPSAHFLPRKASFKSQRHAKQAMRASAMALSSQDNLPHVGPLLEQTGQFRLVATLADNIPCYRNYPLGTILRYHLIDGKSTLISDSDLYKLARAHDLRRMRRHRCPPPYFPGKESPLVVQLSQEAQWFEEIEENSVADGDQEEEDSSDSEEEDVNDEDYSLSDDDDDSDEDKESSSLEPEESHQGLQDEIKGRLSTLWCLQREQNRAKKEQKASQVHVHEHQNAPDSLADNSMLV